jgi:hypothetical protein
VALMVEYGVSGVRSHAVNFVLVHLARIWFQPPLISFIFNLLYKDILYCISCTFNAICKDNYTINCVNIRHKNS